jgi:hypothetical protein
MAGVAQHGPGLNQGAAREISLVSAQYLSRSFFFLWQDSEISHALFNSLKSVQTCSELL